MQGNIASEMSRSARTAKFILVIALVLAAGQSISFSREDSVQKPGSVGSDPRVDSSPWGAASGAEWFSSFPTFNPILKQAGVRWLRGFYEWQTIEPKQGYWNWTLTDRLVENARSNGIHLTAGFAYLASWASANGGTRRFPIKDIEFWRDYVRKLVGRYKNDIKYWEVWNEFNGSFAENATAETYAELVREASAAAKEIDPTAKIGMSVANFDVGFLDAAIKAGAGDHFDFICVHPYDKLNALESDGETDFLSMAATLRAMLEANRQPRDIPLWITEMGSETSSLPDEARDRRQAVLLTKAYVLAIASGFGKVFWFEVRGPPHGEGVDHGLLRANFSPRPSYRALSTMTNNLGPHPSASGWLDLGNSFAFLFKTGDHYVLTAWSAVDRTAKVTFPGDVQVVDLEGNQRSLSQGQELVLSSSPQFILGIPDALVQQAKNNVGKDYPWARGAATRRTANVVLREANIDGGLRQVNVGTTVVVGSADNSWRRTDFSKGDGEGRYVYFSVSPQFVPFGTRKLEVTGLVRRIAPGKAAGLSLDYESTKGYVNAAYVNVPDGDEWHEVKWTLGDANFVGGWGWNFRFNASASANEFLIKEVRVKKTN